MVMSPVLMQTGSGETTISCGLHADLCRFVDAPMTSCHVPPSRCDLHPTAWRHPMRVCANQCSVALWCHLALCKLIRWRYDIMKTYANLYWEILDLMQIHSFQWHWNANLCKFTLQGLWGIYANLSKWKPSHYASLFKFMHNFPNMGCDANLCKFISVKLTSQVVCKFMPRSVSDVVILCKFRMIRFMISCKCMQIHIE